MSFECGISLQDRVHSYNVVNTKTRRSINGDTTVKYVSIFVPLKSLIPGRGHVNSK